MYNIRHETGPFYICTAGVDPPTLHPPPDPPTRSRVFPLNLKKNKNVCSEFAAFFFLVGWDQVEFFFSTAPSLPPTPEKKTRVKDACFHWWPRFLLLSRLQQCIVLMGRDLYRPDACLYSTKREDLAWGRCHSSLCDGALACNRLTNTSTHGFLRKKGGEKKGYTTKI